MMRSCMTKLEFLPEPNMFIQARKNFHLDAACFAFSQALLTSYESFVILLKSRSRTHHPHMHYSYTGGRRKNMPSIQIHPKNVLLLHWEKTPKICFRGFHQINAPSSCCYLSKVCCRKEAWAMLDAHLKKEMNKIAHVFL